jgi:peptidoglycan/xylan/chitin deacetylase (PgdA/CDA1 family)
MSLRSQFGRIRRGVLNARHQRVVPLGDRGPIVSFTFDDFPRTALTAGAPILERYGARGTYYVAMSLMNKTNASGEQFRYEDLISVLTRGHEIASHTFNHLSARTAAYDVFTRDVAWGENALLETLGIHPSHNFAYPYGEATLEAKKKLGPRLLSSRGTCGGFNGHEVDLNLLRANSLYGDVSQAEAAQKLILENEARRSWLIFYTHDVAAHPSPYGCTPELLEASCSFAVSRGARLMTVAQAVQQLAPQAFADLNPPVIHQRPLERIPRSPAIFVTENDFTVTRRHSCRY